MFLYEFKGQILRVEMTQQKKTFIIIIYYIKTSHTCVFFQNTLTHAHTHIHKHTGQFPDHIAKCPCGIVPKKNVIVKTIKANKMKYSTSTEKEKPFWKLCLLHTHTFTHTITNITSIYYKSI